MIPQLDEMPLLLRWAQSAAGKIAIALCYGGLLYLMNNPMWMVAPFIILPFSFQIATRLKLIAILNVLFWFSFGSIYHYRILGYHWNVIETTHLRTTAVNHFPVSLFTHIPAIIALILAWGLTRVFVKTGSRWPIVPTLTAVMTILIFIMQAFRDHPVIWLLMAATMVAMAKSFWYLAYAWQDLVLFKRKNILSYTPMFIPFYTHNFIDSAPVPRGLRDMEVFGAKSSEQMARLQLNGLKLGLWALVCFGTGNLLRFVISESSRVSLYYMWEIPSLNIPTPGYWGLHIYNTLHLPIYIRWIGTLYQAMPYILTDVVGEMGIMIAFVRLIGIHAPRQAYKPYKAIDFLDFFRRIYFYYNELLIQFFFYPMWRWSRRFRLPRSIQFALCIFLAVFIGGLTISYFRNATLIYIFGPMKAFEINLGRSVYFAGLGLAATYSALRRRQRRARGEYVQWAPWRAIVAYCLYSILFSCQGSGLEDTLSDRVIFLLSLFGWGPD